MKDGQVKVVTAATVRRRRIIYLIPLFVAAVVVGFLIDFSAYETIDFSKFRKAIVNIPQRWNPLSRVSSTETDYQPEIWTESSNESLDLEAVTNPSGRVLEFWERPTLFKLNFSWIVNNETICAVTKDGTQDLRIMPILIHTARSHFDERLAIRRTWGALSVYKNWDIRFVFLLGLADRGHKPERNHDKFFAQEAKLKQEQDEFGDIVIGNFIDTYHNLTYKHMMGYKWVLNFCRNAAFVLKADDDMFIDIMRWLDWRSDDLDKIAKNKNEKIPDLYCHTFAGTQPIREVGSKWYASPEDWPEPDYPDYCSGWAYAITVELIQKIYSVQNYRKLFWVDDVFVTGALLEVAKKKLKFTPEIKHIWGEVTSDIAEYRPLCENRTFDQKREFRAVAYVPRGELFERDMQCMFNKTLHDNKPS